MFGMDKAIRAIRTSKQAIVVEGYTDAIMNHQHGIENCLGVGGTAFTPEHIKWLSNMVNEIVLCYDADKAGAREAERVGKECLSQGIPIRLMDIGSGDPDEYLVEHGREKFLELVDNADSLVDFIIKARGLHDIENPDDVINVLKLP